MTQTFDLNKMGVMPMNNSEMEGINGGGFWGPFSTWIAQEIINNWDDIKASFKEGYNAQI